MKSHRSRRVAAATAMVLSLTVAGCAQADPGAAAMTGDRVIPESDVQTAVHELAQLQLPQPIEPEVATRFLAYGPILTDNLAQAGVPMGEAQARKLLPDPNAMLSKPTLDVLTTYAGIVTLQEAQQALQQPAPGTTPAQAQRAQRVMVAAQAADQQISKQLQDGQITFNPKYVRGQENWIQQGVQGMQGQMPEGGAPQDQAPQDQAPQG